MTANSIIIDGVDVSGCEFYEKERALYPDDDYTAPFWVKNYCRLMIAGEFSCEGSDCYYKQLQRAKKEIEFWKHNFEEMKKNFKNVDKTATQAIKEKWQLTEDLTALQQTYEACEKEYKALNEKYIKVLELSKKGVDAYEYCIQELEQENEKLRGIMKLTENLGEQKCQIEQLNITTCTL